ncbi:MAG: efflux transporter outer membrane subunit, partial [Alphaproteobacteria bacterium]|nr:efflux transporter outer membrane subunit [Alphaproteobacteria bacterium]
LVPVMLLAGCSMVPPYQPPTVPAAKSYRESAPWVKIDPDAERPSEKWWMGYDDPALDGLEQALDQNQPTLAQALARYDEAAAYITDARAALYPHVGMEGIATKDRQSNQRPLRGSNQPDLYSADTIDGGISYEVDIWGRVRASVAAARANAQAAQANVAGVRLALQGLIALNYARLCGLDREANVVRIAVSAYEQADQLTNRRYNGGIASKIDIDRSGLQVATAQEQLQEISANRALTEHALATLIGKSASEFSLPETQCALNLPPVTVGVPSLLLRYRPDLVEAERRVAATNDEIGVAKAAFFPSLTLGALGGFQNTGSLGLLSTPYSFWSIGPDLLFSVFDGGKRRAQLRLARAQNAEATAIYRGRVLSAFQEVEDNLSQMRILEEEAKIDTQALTTARDGQEQAMTRYVKGVSNYLDVITAQTTSLAVERNNIDIAIRRFQSDVNLRTSLGGIEPK